jgi:hypothetical protein
MIECITAMVLAVVVMSPLAQADAPSAQLSVDGTAFWIGQTEAAARQAIPRGYRLEPREGGWTLRANSGSAQPYLITVTVSKGRVTRVGLNWPVGSSIRMDAYSALLTGALSHGESCRITGATKGQGALIRRMEFSCGDRRLISILGDWPMGSTADITLE